MVCTDLFYFVLTHCISGFGVDFDLLFILRRSLIEFKESKLIYK